MSNNEFSTIKNIDDKRNGWNEYSRLILSEIQRAAEERKSIQKSLEIYQKELGLAAEQRHHELQIQITDLKVSIAKLEQSNKTTAGFVAGIVSGTIAVIGILVGILV